MHSVFSRVLPAILLVFYPAVAAVAEPPTLEEIEAIARKLGGPLPKEQRETVRWLETHDKTAFAQLAELIEKGDRPRQYRAANVAPVLLSPWSQAVMQGAHHKGQIQLFQVRRPTARPVDHPYAKLVRSAALTALADTLKQAKEADKLPAVEPAAGDPGHDFVIHAMSDCLIEVADVDAADRIAALLAAEDQRMRGAHLIGILDAIHGLPRSYTWDGLCGHSSPEELRAFEIAETARYRKAKDALLAWHKRHIGKSPAERIEAAVDAWDKQLAGENAIYITESGNWATEHQLASLIRFGEPAVDAIRKRATAAPADKYQHRGAFEIALAAITGKTDPEYVNKLFERDTFGQMYACEIIAAAGSRDYTDTLAKLMRSHGPYKKASCTLAVVYRADAVPLLKKAHPGDFVATCAIAELIAWGEVDRDAGKRSEETSRPE